MMGAQPGAPGAPPGAPGGALPPMPGQALGMDGMVGAPPAEGMTAMLSQEAQAAPLIPTEVGPVQGLSANVNELTFKSLNEKFDEWETKAEQDSDRWVEIMDRTLERIFDRQNRVVLEKASGAKAKKNLEVGKLEGSSIFDVEVWNKQLSEDLRPVIKAIIDDSSRLASQKAGMPVEIDEDELNDYIDQQISRAQQVNNTTKEEILAAILIAQSLQEDEDKSGMLKAALAAIFLNLLAKRRRMIAEHEAQAAYNAGTFFASRLLGAPSKTWVTRKDAKVRPEHILMQGNTVDVGENFVVDGVKMRFPGDPSAPAHLTINCRCRLKFDIL